MNTPTADNLTINFRDLEDFTDEVVNQHWFMNYTIWRWYSIKEELHKLQLLSLDQIIHKLKELKLPENPCWFRHHRRLMTNWIILTPENCPFSPWNPGCGHMELNGVAALLILWEFLVREKYNKWHIIQIWPILWVLLGPKNIDNYVAVNGVPDGIESLQVAYWQEVVEYAHQLADELKLEK